MWTAWLTTFSAWTLAAAVFALGICHELFPARSRKVARCRVPVTDDLRVIAVQQRRRN